MEFFSERHGYRPKKPLQFESMDVDLSNRLWNVIERHLQDIDDYSFQNARFQRFMKYELWERYFKQLSDNLPSGFDGQLRHVRNWFLDATWHDAYNLIEFIVQNHPSGEVAVGGYMSTAVIRFRVEINQVLNEESSGYRLIENTISPVTSREEIAEIEKALGSPGPAAENLQKALEYLSDREQPDYRNSIKEAISAVESIANHITGVKYPSLGQALPELEKMLGYKLHGAKRKALLSLYGWASDEARHGLLEESQLTQEDARFALVVCSAFVNYLKTKAANTEISLDSNV